MDTRDSRDKKNGEGEEERQKGTDNINNDEKERLLSSPISESPTLATRYAHRAATLVRSIERHTYAIIGIIIALFILSTLDMLHVKGVLSFLYDPIITVFSAGSIVALFYMVRLTIKSRRVLQRWADVFERSSISAGINISMGNRSREEAVRAIAETVEEIGLPLRVYISSRDNYNEFFDIVFDKEDTTKQFDIAIDKDNIKPTKNGSYQELKLALQKYGSIIVKFVDGTIDANTIMSFSKLLSRYISITLI
jgi:hypothetical protein